MNSRERVIKAIEMKGPDRVPILHSELPGARLRYGNKVTELYAKYPSDFLSFGYPGEEEYGPEIGAVHRDRWGAGWVRTTDDFKGQVIDHPLSDWNVLSTYRFPDPLNWPEFALAEKAIKEDHGEHYILADGDTLWQRMFYLRGFERTLIDLMTDRKEAHILRDRILDYILRRIEKWTSMRVDGISFRDDWGTQTGLMIRPSLWREFFRPAYSEMFKEAHSGGAHVHFHSDGKTREIIPDLVDIGADVLNIQFPVMDLNELRGEFGGRVCFLGGTDRQGIDAFGSVEEVNAHVRQITETFGTFNGGYIGQIEWTHIIPLENMEAALNVWWEYRQ
jgi:uroporphyrinogen decarboxylase